MVCLAIRDTLVTTKVAVLMSRAARLDRNGPDGGVHLNFGLRDTL